MEAGCLLGLVMSSIVIKADHIQPSIFLFNQQREKKPRESNTITEMKIRVETLMTLIGAYIGSS